jgi:hypothetical protein
MGTKPWYVDRRGKLLAELFLHQLEPDFVGDAGKEDIPFDYFVTISTPEKQIKTIAVFVQTTEEEIRNPWQVYFKEKVVPALQNSNIPVLLLIIDVKRGKVFFNWASRLEALESSGQGKQMQGFSFPLIEASEKTIRLLKKEIFKLEKVSV